VVNDDAAYCRERPEHDLPGFAVKVSVAAKVAIPAMQVHLANQLKTGHSLSRFSTAEQFYSRFGILLCLDIY
jgi:hypothetical protein